MLSLGEEKILIIDDDTTTLAILSRQFQGEGFLVKTVETSSQAAKELEQTNFTIAFIDLCLGDTDGLELVREYKKKHPELATVIITGHASVDTAIEAINQGASGYVVKPLIFKELLLKTNEILEKKRLIKEKNDLLIKVQEELNERKKRETQLIQGQKMEAMGKLAEGIAHEINTPLQFINDNITFTKESVETIKSFIDEIAANKELKEKIKELELDYYLEELPVCLNEATDGVKRISKIIQSIKILAKQEDGCDEEFFPHEEIALVLDLAKNKWENYADIKKDFTEGDLPIVFNRQEFSQIILYLITNAVDAIVEKYGQREEKKGEIVIKTEQNENAFLLTVTDNGPGMTEDDISKAYDPFFTNKEIGKGTGLGLTFCYNTIVRKYNGTIYITSEMEKSTEVKISIPMAIKETTKTKL